MKRRCSLKRTKVHWSLHYHVLFFIIWLHFIYFLILEIYYIAIQDGDESSPILTSFEIVKVPDPQMSMVSYYPISYENTPIQSDYDLDGYHILLFKKYISTSVT